MNVDYPLHFDVLGRTARTSGEDHLRDMIEQILFTNPGERVNRPDFGSGLLHAVFQANSREVATALEFTTKAGLQRWLGDVIEVDNLEARADDATLDVLVQYTIRRTGERRAETFQRPVAT